MTTSHIRITEMTLIHGSSSYNLSHCQLILFETFDIYHLQNPVRFESRYHVEKRCLTSCWSAYELHSRSEIVPKFVDIAWDQKISAHSPAGFEDKPINILGFEWVWLNLKLCLHPVRQRSAPSVVEEISWDLMRFASFFPEKGVPSTPDSMMLNQLVPVQSPRIPSDLPRSKPGASRGIWAWSFLTVSVASLVHVGVGQDDGFPCKRLFCPPSNRIKYTQLPCSSSITHIRCKIGICLRPSGHSPAMSTVSCGDEGPLRFNWPLKREPNSKRRYKLDYSLALPWISLDLDQDFFSGKLAFDAFCIPKPCL